MYLIERFQLKFENVKLLDNLSYLVFDSEKNKYEKIQLKTTHEIVLLKITKKS